MNPPTGPLLPARRPASRLRTTLAPFASLQLTLVLLGFGLVLVFAATLDQVNLGIWTVQEKYFRSFVVFTRVGPVTVPLFPGGYTVGGLLLLNLAAAFATRLPWTWRNAGLLLAHSGLILLLVGELLSGLWQQDFHVRLTEGETRAFAESPREFELALVDVTEPAFEDVVALPERLLAAKTPVQHHRLPFRVAVRAYYPHSSLHPRSADRPNLATEGIGREVAAAPQPPTTSPKERNLPSAYVEITGDEGPLGIWLVTPQLAAPQEFTHGGRVWQLALRARRLPLPHSLTLLKFSHDRYPGTEIPRNFASRLLLRDGGGEGREVLVSMNNPLRHGGLAHYQAGFADNDRTSILQVVRNPAWTLPYVACALMASGLLHQFGRHLVTFTVRRRLPDRRDPAGATPARSPSRVATIILVGTAGLVALTLRAPSEPGPFHLADFGRLPVLVNGRVKPLDTVARTSLLLLQGRQRAVDADGHEQAPAAWLLDVLHRPDRAERAPVFEITHPDLLALLQLDPSAGAGGKRFSLAQFRPHLSEVDRQARLAEAAEPALRTAFQNATLQLRNAVALHRSLRSAAAAPGEEELLERLAGTGLLEPRDAERLARALA
ncbi:MAG: cytochrome c biogenesis protein ResB, partial [Opitutaceae bacterium]